MSLRFVFFATLFAPSVASILRRMTAVEFCQNSLYEPYTPYKELLKKYFEFARVKYHKIGNMTWFPTTAYEARLCFGKRTPDCVPVNYTDRNSPEAIAVMAANTYDARLGQCDGRFGCACKDETENNGSFTGTLYCLFLPKTVNGTSNNTNVDLYTIVFESIAAIGGVMDWILRGQTPDGLLHLS